MALNIRKFTQIKKEEDKMTSLDLVNQINIFRKMEGNQKEMGHSDLMKKIRKYNKSMDLIGVVNISQSSYINKQNKKQPCFIMTESEAMIFASAESDIIKYRTIQYFDNLKAEFAIAQASTEHTKDTHDSIKTLIDEYNFNGMAYRTINTSINALVSDKFGLEKKTKKEDFTSSHLEFRAEVEEKIIEIIKKNKTIKLSKAQTRLALSI